MRNPGENVIRRYSPDDGRECFEAIEDHRRNDESPEDHCSNDEKADPPFTSPLIVAAGTSHQVKGRF
jgi:hypothetical protein